MTASRGPDSRIQETLQGIFELRRMLPQALAVNDWADTLEKVRPGPSPLPFSRA